MDEIMAEQKQQEELQQENEVLDKKQLKAAKKLLCILQVFLTFVTFFRSQEQSVLPNINQDKTIAVLTTILRGCSQPLDFYKERYDFYEFNCSSYCTCYNYCSV